MAKPKNPTPQELYRVRKQREEQERVAFLPPGLINHGNTCFMNSVLQGLIATHLLSDLAQFKPIPHGYLSPAPASRRSPLLTNARPVSGEFNKPFDKAMPIGDMFLQLMNKAWDSQARQARESLTPKPLLTILGQKYDQYLDFAQQDAHEFLRILLDATRMEELDVIKKRQPPPEIHKKRRRTTITPSHPAPDRTEPPDDEKLATLSDMIFGGRFASILVCQKCKNVSQTYEDFSDISLSIKAEDYHERKRDRLKNLAKRLTFQGTPSSANVITNAAAVLAAHAGPRAASVPPSPKEREGQLGELYEAPEVHEPRRRSVEVLADEAKDTEPVAAVAAPAESTVSVVLTTGNGLVPSPDVRHVEISPSLKPKEKKDDGWSKIGRRISMTVGLTKSSKERRSRDRSSKDLSRSSLQLDPSLSNETNTVAESNTSASSTPRTSASDFSSSTTLLSGNSHDPNPNPRAPSPTPLNPLHGRIHASRRPHVIRAKSPKPPKPTPGEVSYLREILADITPASSNPFNNLFKPPYHQSNSSNRSVAGPENLWLSMNHFSGIEECLRMFTAVEILDGENMVGCRRCWKIENGEYEVHEDDGNDEDSDSVDHHDQGSVGSHSQPHTPAPTLNGTVRAKRDLSNLRPAALTNIPMSMSTPTVQLYSHTNTSDDHSITSLPTADTASTTESELDTDSSSIVLVSHPDRQKDNTPLTPGGLPIPHISTTGPDSSNSTISPPPIDRSVSLPHSIPIAQPNPRLGQVLNHFPPSSQPHIDTLMVPKARRQLRPEIDTEESSGAESDASAATSTQSFDSTASTSKLPTPHRKPRKPKPVIMRPAYKRYLIGTPPPVLVIHLKRFQQISKTYMLSFSHGFKKLDDYVTFPEVLDLTPYLAPKKEDFGLGRKGKFGASKKEKGEKCLYRLYAVVVHIGNMLGGHYIAYTALPDLQPPTKRDSTEKEESSTSTDVRPPRQWAYISDHIVRLTTLEEVLKAKAYICMYERI
ncbi:hypothetical protein H0H81_000071 [Sphagnurus paluster]|uniref:Ubiquitin carboxyl-terminal hydrolase n=1 Tax=Sphagnurus paluster TaxID=117069 RepID=A0A9P7GQW9_9AGAR|nr:hypothetical protein H0H81_000071 [Sphagnurus paluster]